MKDSPACSLLLNLLVCDLGEVLGPVLVPRYRFLDLMGKTLLLLRKCKYHRTVVRNVVLYHV